MSNSFMVFDPVQGVWEPAGSMGAGLLKAALKTSSGFLSLWKHHGAVSKCSVIAFQSVQCSEITGDCALL